jgi:tetratricopeptide (TPR) repeat protein
VNRSIIFCIAIALGTVASTSSAWAQEAPSKEQLEAAKKAFGEGKALYDEGKFPEAVEKFKESYRLSRNPLLLYNIGHTLDQAGQKDKALFYYRKFLADAPANAPQRKDVQKRVEVIEKENLEADLMGTSTPPPAGTGNTTTTTQPKVEEPKKEIKIKPAGTYSEKDFQHALVETAPPGKPLDITAFVPEDSGFTVTLYYRGSGDATFVAKPMKWRYKELVGRVPAAKVGGTSIQYYIEVKDQAGIAVAKSGKSTSPNLVYLESGATPRFYPDLTDDGEQAISATQRKRNDEEDPLGGKVKQEVDPEDEGKTTTEDPTELPTPGTGFRDVGSSKFTKAKWISTGAAGALIAGSVVSFLLAKKQAGNLETDSTACGSPPCQIFDEEYGIPVQEAGKRYNTIHKVTTVFGVAAAGVAAYFWYRELTAKKRGELKVTNKNQNPETTWAITPSLTDGFMGAAAAATF